jgi:DNA-binding response OmpR family regulator
MTKIAIIEDDPTMRALLKDNLEAEGYKTVTAADGEDGLKLAAEERPDVVLLDVMLPKMDGIEVCRRLRAKGLNTPVIMLTARKQEVDVVVGLEIGADDYVTKPFSMRELLARVKAILRRRGAPGELARFAFDDVEADFRRRVLRKKGKESPLTHYEAEILRMLVSRAGQTVKRNEMLDEIWGEDAFPTNRTIDNHIVRLRAKIEKNPDKPRHILTVHGEGYKFVE